AKAPKEAIQEQAAGLDLLACRHIALERQPAIAAARASLNAAQARVASIENLRIPTCLRPDLAIRRKQAPFGIHIAQAGLFTAEWETNYAVTRTYLGVLYAREQKVVADRVVADDDNVGSLRYLYKLAEQIYKERSRPDVKDWHVEQIAVYLR